jgi:protein-S-isoprenylcysteine O-methyltransferase Ste14
VKRHRTDLVALLFGLAFAAIGAAFLVHELTDRAVDPAWVAAAGCTVLGVVALAVTLTRRVHRERDVEAEAP